MTFEEYVKSNEKIIQILKDRLPGEDVIDMYYGTLDFATARFNSILIKLSQDAVLKQEHLADVDECFMIIQKFYSYVQRFEDWPRFARPFFKIILHGIGTRQIPKIKKLHNKLVNDAD